MWGSVSRRAVLGAAVWVTTQHRIRIALAEALPAPVRPTATATADVQQHATTSHPAGQQQRSRPPSLQEGTHFAVLSGSDGSTSRLSKLAAAMQQADVVLLGEIHDDPVAHALQLELVRRTADKLGYQAASVQSVPSIPAGSNDTQLQQGQQHTQQQNTTTTQLHQHPHQQQRQNQHQFEQQQQRQPQRQLLLSLEMFERDVQPALNEYLSGAITQSDLIRDARPWPNYSRDYQPIVAYCKQLGVPVVAANAPRRYVSLAGRAGSQALEQLPASSKQWLPPLPHAAASQAYARKIQHSMQHAAAEMQHHKQQHLSPQQEQPQHDKVSTDGCPYIGFTVSSNFLAAQALWDATMAYSIAQALQTPPKLPAPSSPSPNNQQQQHQPGATLPLHPGSTTAATAPHKQPSASHVGGADQQLPEHSSSNPSSGPGPLVVHLCGKFHCEGRLGIPEHLLHYAPTAKVLVVVFVPEGNIAGFTGKQFEAAGLAGAADFVVLTDGSLPRSYQSVHPL